MIMPEVEMAFCAISRLRTAATSNRGARPATISAAGDGQPRITSSHRAWPERGAKASTSRISC
jgi:hypothetical protein